MAIRCVTAGLWRQDRGGTAGDQHYDHQQRDRDDDSEHLTQRGEASDLE
jgi:hypothetical protein